MTKFKVDDLVVGNKLNKIENPYSITKHGITFKVEKIFNDTEIQLLGYRVKAKYFDLLKQPEPIDIKKLNEEYQQYDKI